MDPDETARTAGRKRTRLNDMKLLSLTLLLIAHNLAKGEFENPYSEILPVMLLFKPKARPISCVSNCRALPDGDYHSCKGCTYFATCSNGYLIDGRKCAWFGGLLWHDKRKRCEWSSSTCSRVVYSHANYGIDERCVRSCFGMPNGDYQSCNGCRIYVTCSNDLTYDHRPCPWFLLWDDNRKRCLWGSSTCNKPFVL